jgi:hypothetical protein
VLIIRCRIIKSLTGAQIRRCLVPKEPLISDDLVGGGELRRLAFSGDIERVDGHLDASDFSWDAGL